MPHQLIAKITLATLRTSSLFLSYMKTFKNCSKNYAFWCNVQNLLATIQRKLRVFKSYWNQWGLNAQLSAYVPLIQWDLILIVLYPVAAVQGNI